MNKKFNEQKPVEQPAGNRSPGEQPRVDREEGNLKHGNVGGNLEAEKEQTEGQQRPDSSRNAQGGKWEEQDAPYKNTDNARVKVKKDGSPGI